MISNKCKILGLTIKYDSFCKDYITKIICDTRYKLFSDIIWNDMLTYEIIETTIQLRLEALNLKDIDIVRDNSKIIIPSNIQPFLINTHGNLVIIEGLPQKIKLKRNEFVIMLKYDEIKLPIYYDVNVTGGLFKSYIEKPFETSKNNQTLIRDIIEGFQLIDDKFIKSTMIKETLGDEENNVGEYFGIFTGNSEYNHIYDIEFSNEYNDSHRGFHTFHSKLILHSSHKIKLNEYITQLRQKSVNGFLIVVATCIGSIDPYKFPMKFTNDKIYNSIDYQNTLLFMKKYNKPLCYSFQNIKF